MHGGQTGERRTELDPPRGQRLPDLLATDRVRVRREQTGEIAARRLGPSSTACRAAAARRTRLPVVVGLHGERRDTGRSIDATAVDLGVVVQQQQLFEPDVAHLGTRRRTGCARRPVPSRSRRPPGKAGNVVDLVVAEPRQCRGADVGLPGVPLGLLRQPDMRPEQRMDRDGESAICLGLLTVVGHQSWTMLWGTDPVVGVVPGGGGDGWVGFGRVRGPWGHRGVVWR